MLLPTFQIQAQFVRRNVAIIKKSLLSTEALRFAAVGFLGFFVNSVILWFLHGQKGWPLILSESLAVETAIIATFFLHHTWTYKSYQSKSFVARIMQFNLSALSGALITVGTLWLFTKLGLFYLAALAISAGIAMAWNFTMNRIFIWTTGEE